MGKKTKNITVNCFASCLKIFHFQRVISFSVKGCKTQAFAPQLRHFSREDLYRATPAMKRDLGDQGLIRTSTGARLVASYY